MDLTRFLMLRLQGAHIDLPVFNDKGSPPQPPAPQDPAKQAEAEAAANRYHITSPFGTVRWINHPKAGTTLHSPKNPGDAPQEFDAWRQDFLKGKDSSWNEVDPVVFKNEYEKYLKGWATDNTTSSPADSSGMENWEQIIELSPEQRAQLDERQKIAKLLGSRSEDILSSTPGKYEFNGAEDPTTNKFFQAQKKLLDVSFNKDEDRERQRLTNQGIPEGSAAFREAMDEFGRRKSDAYETASANALGEGFRQDITTRQQNLNEVASALGGQQLQPIGGGGSPLDVSGAFTNYQAGLNSQYQGRVAGYNANVSQSNSEMAAIAAIIAAMSDRRLKQEIVKLFEVLPGINLYRFRYKAGGRLRLGVMADEVEKVIPQAVLTRDDGYKMVDYFAIFGTRAAALLAA